MIVDAGLSSLAEVSSDQRDAPETISLPLKRFGGTFRARWAD